MTRPHPIVGIAAKLTYGLRRSADQPHVGKLLDDESEELVAAEKSIHLDTHAGILGKELFGQRLAIGGRNLLELLLPGNGRHVADDFGRDVHDFADEPHGKTGSGQLLLGRHGPKTVLEIIVLDGRKLLDGRKTAMMVGEKQAVGRDDLPSAPVTEDDDGILKRRLVNAVNIFGGKFTPARLHRADIHLLEIRQEPHPLVGEGRNRSDRSDEQQQKFLHIN